MVDKEMLTAMEDLLDRKLDEKLDEKLDQKFDEKLKPINDKLEKLDKRTSNLEISMKKLDERTSNLEVSMKKLDERTSNLEVSMKKLDECTSNLETSVEKLEAGMTYVKVVQLENNVIPRLSTIEGCYLDTYKRYIEKTDQIDRIDLDISVLKQVVASHSERLKKAQ